MDKDKADHLHERTARRPPEKETPTPDVPSQVGNRSFTSMVQRAMGKTQGAGPLDPQIRKEIDQEKGGGRPLDNGTLQDMETQFGTDLSQVRIHTGSKADQLSRAVQAEAFATGSDIFFKDGKYSPESTDGRRLLAHELTHVVQQRGGRSQGGSQVSHPDDPHEVEARAVGDAVAAAPAAVQREPMEEEEELQMSVDRESMEEEEELQMSEDSDSDLEEREGEEEELQA